MNELPEIALTEQEVTEILRSCNGQALLVGGQALAFWAHHYGVTPPAVLAENVTSDADFIGSAQMARELGEVLKSQGWKFWAVAFDDATSQTAKLSKRIEGQGIKQIDFLGSIIGLDTERIRDRAVRVHLADGTGLLVLHPLDVLESRLKNLAALPSKRNTHGIAQAQLAISIGKRFLEQLMHDNADTRLLLNAIERIVRIALDKSLDAVLHDYELDPLTAVSVEQVPSQEFQERRWPQVRRLAAEQRQAHARRQEQLALRKKKR